MSGADRSAPSLWLEGRTEGPSVAALPARAQVVIVGAGFTGLWTAIALTDRDPTLDVVVLEAETVGHGASGRNGGFVEPSLTHGIANGLAHFPDEYDELHRLGAENHTGLLAFVRDHEIECHLETTGSIGVATAPWQLDGLTEEAELHRRYGDEVEVLDAEAVRAEVDSPTYLGGLHVPTGSAIVHPGELVRGLARVVRDRGVTIHEHRPVTAIESAGTGVRVVTAAGEVEAERVVLATNAYSHRVVRATARHFVPVYDHVLVTEPLDTEQLARIGWKRRQGLYDRGNQFHYYRMTHDDRILWGGYDAVYHYGNGIGPEHDHRRATYDLLARHFRDTFPQLSDVRFDRWWGGAIATTTRFTVTFGEALDGRVVYGLGYTGLGVAATRFAGRVLSDKLLDPTSAVLDLELTTREPFPFPPEPLRWLGVQVTRRAIAKADRRSGQRGPWLALLDRFGIGFDS